MRRSLPLLPLLIVVLARCSSQPSPQADVAELEKGLVSGPAVIEIPIVVPLHLLSGRIEQQVPKSIEHMNAFEMDGNGRYGAKYRIGREAVRLRTERGLLRAATTIHYALEGCRRTRKGIRSNDYIMFPCVSCGVDEPMRRVELELVSRLFWQGWSIRSKTRPLPASYPSRCQVTILNVDITDRVVAPRITEMLGGMVTTIDSATAKSSDFRREAQAVWSFLSSPLKLGERAWLVFKPQRLATGPIRAEQNQLITSIALYSSPEIVFGDQPVSPRSALPLPSQFSKPAPSASIPIPFDVDLPFSEATRILNERVASQTFRVGDRQVRVFSAIVKAGGRGRAAIEMDVEFRHLLDRFRGTVRLSGIPRYDPKQQMIVASELDYELSPQGRQWLARVSDRLVHEKLRREIASRARWPVSTQLNALKAQLQTAINQPIADGVRIEGRVHDIRIGKVAMDPVSLRVRGTVTGSARVMVDSLGSSLR